MSKSDATPDQLMEAANRIKMKLLNIVEAKLGEKEVNASFIREARQLLGDMNLFEVEKKKADREIEEEDSEDDVFYIVNYSKHFLAMCHVADYYTKHHVGQYQRDFKDVSDTYTEHNCSENCDQH